MNSNLLSSIGLGNLDIAYILIAFLVLIIVLFILFAVVMVKHNRLKKRYERLMKGRGARSLEKEIMALFEDIDILKELAEKDSREIRRIYKRLESCYQKMGIVKYDAFRAMGGKLSYSLAILDEKDNGFLINSVHSSDGCYSYAKEIAAGTCDINLGEEEQDALDLAMETHEAIERPKKEEQDSKKSARETKQKSVKERSAREKKPVRSRSQEAVSDRERSRKRRLEQEEIEDYEEDLDYEDMDDLSDFNLDDM